MSDLLTVRDEIRDLLESIKDEGTEIDGGAGLGSADLWIKIGGKEFYLTIGESKSTAQAS